MAVNGHKFTTFKERREIRKKRRQLRKDLKRLGISSRAAFEATAQEMGLVYGGSKLFWPFWGLVEFVGGTAPLWAAVGALAVATIAYSFSKMYVDRSDFTITVSGGLLEKGFQLSETVDFEDPQVRLVAEPNDQFANAMSIQDLPTDLDTVGGGSHHGENYFAYTFWVRNAGQQPIDCEWYVRLMDSTNRLEQALWVMIYEEGSQTIYAAYAPDGGPEHLSGYADYPLREQAANPDTQYYRSAAGAPGVRTTGYNPYSEERRVAGGTFENFEPAQKRRYTVVLWLEGDDPECTNELLEGTALFDFNFRIIGEEDEGLFGDIVDFEANAQSAP